MLVQLQVELFVHRQVVKARGLRKSAVDHAARHVMPGQHKKTHRGQRIADPHRGRVKSSGPTGEVIPNIDDRNGLRHCDHAVQHVSLIFKRIGEGWKKGVGRGG
jgi:hypothetical protein